MSILSHDVGGKFEPFLTYFCIQIEVKHKNVSALVGKIKMHFTELNVLILLNTGNQTKLIFNPNCGDLLGPGNRYYMHNLYLLVKSFPVICIKNSCRS